MYKEKKIKFLKNGLEIGNALRLMWDDDALFII